MNIESAIEIIEALLERLDADAVSNSPQFLSVVSKLERRALTALVRRGPKETKPSSAEEPVKLADGPPGDRSSDIAEVPEIKAKPIVPLVLTQLDLQALNTKTKHSCVVCIDFGTAKSKAFASKTNSFNVQPEDLCELGLGALDGDLDGSQYTVSSSVWISDDGLLFSGSEAMQRSADYVNAKSTGRRRLDSLKQRLNLTSNHADIREHIPVEENPSQVLLTYEDVICFFLAYLNDLIGSELERLSLPRLAPRRFTLPAWPEEKRRWAHKSLSSYLKRSQILADTFRGRWKQGIPVADFKNAVEATQALDDQLNHLLDPVMAKTDLGISEPVAAGSSRLRSDKSTRNLVLVVDAGAGTTDFAMFWVPQTAESKNVFTIPPGSDAVKWGGDRVDEIFLDFLLSRVPGHLDPVSREKHADYFKRRSLRSLKHSLLRNGSEIVPLVTNEEISVTAKEFLNYPQLNTLSIAIEAKLTNFLGQVEIAYASRTDGAIMLLTGGGASLPFIQSLATKTWSVAGKQIVFKQPRQLPILVQRLNADFQREYPQLAVAVGGTLPLINEKPTLLAFQGGVDHHGVVFPPSWTK